MAGNFMAVDRTKPLGSALLQAGAEARHFAQSVAALQSIMAAMNDGVDFSVLETQFGLPAGKGNDVNYMIGVLKNGLDGIAQMKTLADWFGQM